jgi:hypothetical protein
VLTGATQGCTDPAFCNYNPTAVCDDGSCSASVAPFTETFDVFGNLAIWSQSINDDIDWTQLSGSTGSSSTGPSDDITGGGYYLYTEASGTYYKTAKLYSQCIDISALSDPSLIFNYHMYGSSMGVLDIYVDGVSMWSMSGDQGNQWNLDQISLLGVSDPTNVVIEFIGTTGASYTSDIAIDQISVDEFMILPIYGCTDSTATNYDPNANTDDGSCCYGTSANLQVYTNDQCSYYAQYMGWELQDANGNTIASGGTNAGETWQDYTYYNYCLPINDSCDVYNLVLYDSQGYGWGACSQATALITSANGDTLLNIGGNCCWSTQSYVLTGAVQGCTDPTASNYDANAVCDDGSCVYYLGCIDPSAFNYDSLATLDDGSCCYDINGCSCAQSNAGNNFESGWRISDATDVVAADLIVNQGEDFVLYKLTANIFMDPGSSITTITLNYYDDASGDPGSIIGSETLIPSSHTYLGNAFGYDINEVVLNLTPFTFSGQSSADSIYWLGLGNAVTTTAGVAYWETTTQSVIGDSARGNHDGYWFHPNYECVYEFEGNCISLINAGCMDSLAYNYDPLADTSDGSCCYVSGCNDPIANNYDPAACFDDGSCTYNYGCTDSAAANYDPSATMDDGSCIYCNQNAVDTLNYTGAMQTYTVPAGVTSVTIEAYGAEGVGMNGFTAGTGGGAMGDLSVVSGQVLNIFVGGSSTGYNGGGLGLGGANGGGASDIRINGSSVSDRVIVAGGGGGAGGDSWQCYSPTNGNGGGGVAVGNNFVGGGGGSGYSFCGTDGGSNGGTSSSASHGGGGGGGGLLSGGDGATATYYTNGIAMSGALGQGGDSHNSTGCSASGAGGGGYYGGGGGAGGNCGAGMGGGGSSWTGSCTNPSFTSGVQYGNGLVIISYSTQTCTGCTDPAALNYDSLALYDDGSCCYVAGCNDPIANNYDPAACFDDGSCTYNYGCTDSAAANYDSTATIDDGSCIYCNQNAQNAVDTLNYTGSMQTYTVPAGVTSVTIEAYGAQGGNAVASGYAYYGGKGAYLSGDFNVTSGEQIDILVGEQPPTNGGGGGSFVVKSAGNIPLLIAGGGGGASGTCCGNGEQMDGEDGVISQSGTAGFNGSFCSPGAGGTGGYGGGGGAGGSGGSGGGGGFYGDGTDGEITGNAGNSYLNGGAGGIGPNATGGYGGGGGSGDQYGWVFSAPGGGGGYSGGGGNCGGNDWYNGGGGGSYNSGTNQNNTSGVQTGNGLVIISYSIQNTAGCTDPLANNYDSLAVCDDSSCVYTCDLTTTLTILNATSPTSCDGFAFVNATSSYPPINFEWFDISGALIATGVNSVSNLCYGLYTLQTTDNMGCVVVDTFIIGDLYGCTNPLACNYDPYANIDDGSCLTAYGCMDVTACNYDATATCDDGSCLIAYGCMDASACNYDSTATCDDGSCLTAYGCIDVTACNYDATATCDDGSCLIAYGCMDASACNYDSTATCDDGSCLTAYGCTDTTAFNYDPAATCDDGSCVAIESGCTDSTALNYYAGANTDDGSCCYVAGCTDASMFNYDSLACYNDGSCIAFIYGCTDSTAYNYSAGANIDNGSCQYCDLTFSLMVTQNSSSSACDGWAFVSASSSNGPVSYLWSDGSTQNNIIGLCSGTYTLQITDAVGCIVTESVSIGTFNGCTDSTALNYDPLANNDDGSCIYCVYGCTDPVATNYYAGATCDDGSCTYVPSTCTNPSPTGAYVNELIHDRVRVNWDNMNDTSCMVTQYRIRYRELGTSTWLSKTMANSGLCLFGLNTTSKKIVGLTPSTTYEYYMKAWYCGGGVSTWSAIQNFTTTDECENVINFAVSTPINTKATFTWDSTAAYSFARIKLRVDTTGGVWTSAGGFGVFYPALSKAKNGLTPGISYRAQARTWCDPTGGAYRSAAWSPLVFWTQPTTIKLAGESLIANLTIYPNPSRDVFNISFTSDAKQNLRVRILNVIGEELINENLEQFIGEYTKQINLSDNAKGIYFLEIETNDRIINKKLILQ